MQIVYVAGDARRELDVRVNNPSATVIDLVRALDSTAVGVVLPLKDASWLAPRASRMLIPAIESLMPHGMLFM